MGVTQVEVEREPVGRGGKRQGPNVMGLSPGGLSPHRIGQVRWNGTFVGLYKVMIGRGWHYPLAGSRWRGRTAALGRQRTSNSFGASRLALCIGPTIPTKCPHPLFYIGQLFRERLAGTILFPGHFRGETVPPSGRGKPAPIYCS